ncbi:protein MpUGT9 [Marchantia polymorpha subsp. ruderalis]|uniref:Glycosyltransferase n=2 Tax=Marchantia polymorpha TaxID=3197 RepID=A0A176WIL1_MARPO|nr:hypothetical protein AXG93_673s1340 [Marchantia polymorpha subsp. ruderalis]PTQ40353.1 hypothetical protein MARPO_0040s0038 [Marchantia polymorpha]BBN03224.1 hypothetical protein Mp_2g21770 [Marchantia polymorpha subsp. ruderalis]|eukprot:PTQ40353.1 hypothetical protein MARPO_0040s0038 [Marchantia polymorpha]
MTGDTLSSPTSVEEVNGKSHSKTSGNGHLLVLGFGSQAHVVNSFKVGMYLAERGVTITYVSRQKYINQLKQSYSPEKLKALGIRTVGLADGYEGTHIFDRATRFEQVFQPYLEELIADRKAGLAIPTAILADRFLQFAKDVAQKLEIKRYVFFSASVSEPMMYMAVQELHRKGTVRKLENGEFVGLENVPNVPGCDWMRQQDLPWVLWADTKAMLDISHTMTDADGLVLNYFDDLGPRCLETLGNSLSAQSGTTGKAPKLFTIGPLSNAATSVNVACNGGELKKTEMQCFDWLDQQPTSSVLYVCFGSIFRPDAPQLYELALGLEASNQRFLLVLPATERQGLRKDGAVTLEDELPENFASRVSDRGLIVYGWVPQIQMLAHTSVGGFMSHCGWSSCLESFGSGVPMIAWPMAADQNPNCRYVVNELKVGIELTGKKGDMVFASFSMRVTGKKYDTFVEKDEIARAVEVLMEGEEGKATRARAQALRVKLGAALAVGGSSYRHLQELADHINE